MIIIFGVCFPTDDTDADVKRCHSVCWDCKFLVHFFFSLNTILKSSCLHFNSPFHRSYKYQWDQWRTMGKMRESAHERNWTHLVNKHKIDANTLLHRFSSYGLFHLWFTSITYIQCSRQIFGRKRVVCN